jgi:hypothetical protein
MKTPGIKKFSLQHPKTYLVIFLLDLVMPFALYFGLVYGIAWLSLTSGSLLGLGLLTLLILK